MPVVSANINVGLLGHVDAGKTSIARVLTETKSTACLDKDPQSQSRGITLDLGFSSFKAPVTHSQYPFNELQYTLVDHPGHASLLRTVIGGSAIIDLMFLIIDITKGIQTQTGECIVLGELMSKSSVILLSKVDLVPSSDRETVIEKAKKKLKAALKNTHNFCDSPIIPFSAHHPLDGQREILLSTLEGLVFNKVPRINKMMSSQTNNPLLISFDHCFSVMGKGTVLTGTVLSGILTTDSNVCISGKPTKVKVKSIQSFKTQVSTAQSGDRVGILVKKFPSSSIERGFISDAPLPLVSAFIVKVNKVAWFKGEVVTGQQYHVSIGFETVIGKITLFSAHDSVFNGDYEALTSADDHSDSAYAYVRLVSPVTTPTNALCVFSRLDFPENSKQCRIAFYGSVHYLSKDNGFNIYKKKQKVGVLERFASNNSAIIKDLFDSVSQARAFIGGKLHSQDGRLIGHISLTFGQSGKVKADLVGESVIDVGQSVILFYRRNAFENSRSVSLT
ncbi:hypothetical protein P9112_011250 [Eukaryota sp. TZLM1-RC]